MARLVLTVLSLVFITCVVADYDSHERENHGVIGEDDMFTNLVDKLKNSSQCSSETSLLELDPSDEEYKRMAKKMQSTIGSHPSMYFTKYNITKIERVINGCLMKAYKMRQEHIESQSKHLNERMLFYGTPYADDIVANGFNERYTNINGMFGAGFYFAECSSKSNQYVLGLLERCMMCERKMIISRVTLGDIYKVKKPMAGITHAPEGYHSVQGEPSPKGLKYDEFVIYRKDQAYPEYLITYNLVP